MAIDETARHHLRQTLDDRLGAADAATLMEHLPPVGWADVATKTDLNHLQTLLEAKIDRVETRLEAKIDGLGSQLRTEIAELKSDLITRMQRQNHLLIGTLAPFAVALLGLLAAAIFRSPTAGP